MVFTGHRGSNPAAYTVTAHQSATKKGGQLTRKSATNRAWAASCPISHFRQGAPLVSRASSTQVICHSQNASSSTNGRVTSLFEVRGWSTVCTNWGRLVWPWLSHVDRCFTHTHTHIQPQGHILSTACSNWGRFVWPWLSHVGRCYTHTHTDLRSHFKYCMYQLRSVCLTLAVTCRSLFHTHTHIQT